MATHEKDEQSKAMHEVGGDAVDRQVRAWEAREREAERTRRHQYDTTKHTAADEARNEGSATLLRNIMRIAIGIALCGTAVEIGPDNPALGWMLLAIALVIGMWNEPSGKRTQTPRLKMH